MRIVIDLQAAQSEGSRNRGIGRYSLSLARAMIRNGVGHDFMIALNGAFPETISSIRKYFRDVLPQEKIRIWNALPDVGAVHASNSWQRRAAELTRESFLASLEPDVIHISSLIEGFSDDVVTSIGRRVGKAKVAVTLYDLIPYIHRKPYLEYKPLEQWYMKKIGYMTRADLWLAISESSRQEGIGYLNLPEDSVINVSTDADPQFTKIDVSDELEQQLRARYGLNRPYVMYTGGIDHRKNIDRLITAYAGLTQTIRDSHQLAIVCSVSKESRETLERHILDSGLRKEDVVLTGYVPESDLILLYNLCALFVFPSWHEGFGLPVLEAMRCGAPVIAANASSLPEVVGSEAALFDPYSSDAIQTAIARGLTDSPYREELLDLSASQSRKFSWDASACKTLAAMERMVGEADKPSITGYAPGTRRPRLAYVSPLPNEKTGIADYSADLIPELYRHYDIDVVISQKELSDPWIEANCGIRSTEWFKENHREYDRVLYHFGNSIFHQHMFDLIETIPGIVVLHDFHLSGILSFLEASGTNAGCWINELYTSHGYHAVYERINASDLSEVVFNYPCSLTVIQKSLGLIVHSRHSLELARLWYGGNLDDWAVIPLLRQAPHAQNRKAAREKLGLSEDVFLVCCFGFMGLTKLNQELLDAWLDSELSDDPCNHLVFVGANDPEQYGLEIENSLTHANTRSNITITGWASEELYRTYLEAADVGVQLRTLSRGETSASVLDCMSYGLAVIVNANGSMSELDDHAVIKIPDNFTRQELSDALQLLWKQGDRRKQLGAEAAHILRDKHSPRVCGDQYASTIERFYAVASYGPTGLCSTIIDDASGAACPDHSLISLANSIDKNYPVRNRLKHIFIDVTYLISVKSHTGKDRTILRLVSLCLQHAVPGVRIEPVYRSQDGIYRYARQFSCLLMNCPSQWVSDGPVDYRFGDVIMNLKYSTDLRPEVVSIFRDFRNAGLRAYCVIDDTTRLAFSGQTDMASDVSQNDLKESCIQYDGILCLSEGIATEIQHEDDKVRDTDFRILTLPMELLDPSDQAGDECVEAAKAVILSMV